MYRKLTSAGALIPPAVGFEFDREGLSKNEQAQLIRLSDGKLKFLPRRMYENYLLDKEAIAAVLNSLPTFSDAPATSDQVRDWMVENGAKEKYLRSEHRTKPVFGNDWLENVHAADLLADLFGSLSDAKEEFRKPIHPVQLTEWLIQNKSDELSELRKFIEEWL